MMLPRFELHTDRQSLASWAKIGADAVRAKADQNDIAGKRLHAVLRLSSEHKRDITWMREGLIPSYACDDHDAEQRAEAHAEALTCASCFRSAFRRRRCIVPATILHEVRHLAPNVVHPCSFAPLAESIFGIAAVWETWTNNEGYAINSFAIVTILVTPLLRTLFGRMPVILDTPEEQERWLEPRGSGAEPTELLKPLSPCQLRDWNMFPEAVKVHAEAGAAYSKPALVCVGPLDATS